MSFGQTPQTYRNFITKKESKKEKIALIVANNAYTDSPLKYPILMAKKLASALKENDFDIMIGHDLNRKGFSNIIKGYVKKLESYEVGFIFYLGHGFQVHGDNYLIPIDAHPNSLSDIKTESIALNHLLEKIYDPDKPKAIFIDACRADPFKYSDTKVRFLKVGDHAKVGSVANTEIYFSVKSGKVVRDDNPYIKYFIEELNKGGCLTNITRRVYQRINAYDPNMEPAEYGARMNEICFEKNKVKVNWRIEVKKVISEYEGKEKGKLNGKEIPFLEDLRDELQGFLNEAEITLTEYQKIYNRLPKDNQEKRFADGNLFEDKLNPIIIRLNETIKNLNDKRVKYWYYGNIKYAFEYYATESDRKLLFLKKSKKSLERAIKIYKN